MASVYNWKRYWCPREGSFNLSDNGYLVAPDDDYGRIIAQDVRPFGDIASTPCLVLLGEPGIGKTTALEEIAASESANFATLQVDLGEYSSDERLYRHVFESSAIREWLTGTHTLSVLLDSLDECRVEGIAKFLSGELSRLPSKRLRLRLACRTAEWPITLEEALNSAWGKESVGVYELAPLTKANVAEAAIKSELSANEFLDEIERVRAQSLAIKPVSLKFLLNRFRAAKCLPADECSLYRQGCYCLCEDSQERRDARMPHACDADHRFTVAQRIAYLSVFSGKYAVWTGAQDVSMPAEDLSASSIHGREVCNGDMFNITEEVVHDTLNTGLFTARGAHRMGWAHQTYAEFLAAQYVLSRLDARQRRSLLLLTDSVGADVVPQLSEVAARVATSDQTLFEEILETAPSILLRSDVATADYSRRAALLSSLLRKFNIGDIHFRDVDNADRLRHLNHPEIADQLRPFITGDTYGLQARIFALDTLEACGADALQKELLDLALDKNVNIELRCRAISILGKNVDIGTVERIRPLAQDLPEDPDRRIKGYVLRALWPKHISSEQLFALLTPKGRNRLMCAYDMFIAHEVVDTLRVQDLPAALSWVKAQGQRQSLNMHFQRLLDGVLIKAWNMLDEPGILPLLSDTLGRRMITEHGNIMGDAELTRSGFLSDERKRRMLLTEMVSKVDNFRDDAFCLSFRFANIARPSDFFWLVDCALAAQTEPKARVWARLCRWNYNINAAAESDAILSANNCNTAIQAEFKPLLEPVVLNSPLAEELRRDHAEYSRFDIKRKDPPLLDPLPVVRVQRILDRCEGGEPGLWWCVAREMTLAPRSVTYRDNWEPDITDLPGWKDATIETQNRIREAAKLYILNCDDRRREWVNKGSTIMYPANAGYQALRLIHASQPAFIKELSADVWARWAVALLCYPLSISKEESAQFHKPIVSQMFTVAPSEATDALEIVIYRESKESSCLSVLSRIEHIECPQLSNMLKRLISEKRLDGGGAARVFSCLITQHVQNATEWVMSMIPSPVPQCGLDRAYALGAAEALCSPANQSTWPAIWSSINDDAEFGRNLVGRLASFFRSDTHPLTGLSDEQLANLYIWVSQNFPHREDPEIEGAHTVSEREEIAHWRDQYLLQLLINRGTVSACNSLRDMIGKLPEVSWLRFTWQGAVKLMRAKTWRPLEPSALNQLAATANSRTVSSGDDLMRVISESLERLQGQLRGQTPMIKLLWDFQRDKKTWCPKDEGSLSDFVAGHLRRELREKGIVVNREVEIRPLRGTKAGQETDILVEAVDLMARHDSDAIQVIIETKGCWNPELNSAMQAQLVERYLAENQCCHGLYLVGYYWCESWDNRDHRKRPCREDIEAISQKLKTQAEALSDSRITVVVRLLDLRF